jgi:hypothetical protein
MTCNLLPWPPPTLLAIEFSQRKELMERKPLGDLFTISYLGLYFR